MKRAFVWMAALGILLAGLGSPVSAQEAKPASGVKADILWQIEDAEKKLVALAEATPAEKFAWRPAEGIRSVGEVYMHVAGANYFFPTFWGGKIPEGLNPREFEKQGADKAKVVDTLKKSFDHVRSFINAMPESDLDKQINLFGNQAAGRRGLLIVATHAHEHLG
ncbi:MAG TPA: DinB family protein, partial [Thermoanaerobaculia bacterium]|nr:DinB family protein [Thermoanaerobaculia bacterium]